MVPIVICNPAYGSEVTMFIITDMDQDRFEETVRFLLARGIHFKAYPRGECWEITLLGGF